MSHGLSASPARTPSTPTPPTASAVPLSPHLSAFQFAAYHAYHRDLCRHAATLPRQLSDHLSQLHTLRSTSRTFSSHLDRLSHPPPSATSTSALRHFAGVADLLRVAVLQQLDTALTMLVESVSALGSSVDSLTRLCDSLRTAAMAVDAQLLTADVATVRVWEELAAPAAIAGGGSAIKQPGSGRGSASGSHRKQRPNGKQQHSSKQQSEDDDEDVDPSLTAPVSPYSLLLMLEDIVYALTSLHQQHTVALAQLQQAVTGGAARPDEVVKEALEALGSAGIVNGSVMEEWLSIIRRACKI